MVDCSAAGAAGRAPTAPAARGSSFTRPCDYFVQRPADAGVAAELRRAAEALAASPVVCTPLLFVEMRPREGATAEAVQRPPVALARFLEASEHGDARAEAVLQSLGERLTTEQIAEQIAALAAAGAHARFARAVAALRRRSVPLAAALDAHCRAQFAGGAATAAAATASIARHQFLREWAAATEPALVIGVARAAAATPGATPAPLERLLRSRGLPRRDRLRAEAALGLFSESRAG